MTVVNNYANDSGNADDGTSGNYADDQGSVDLYGNYVVDSNLLPDEYDQGGDNLPTLESFYDYAEGVTFASSGTYRYSVPDHVVLTG